MSTNVKEEYLTKRSTPRDPQADVQIAVENIYKSIYPVILKIRDELNSYKDDEIISRLRDIFYLCANQIKKSLQNLLDIFKLEHNAQIFLQESRLCNLERLFWCTDKIHSVEMCLNKIGKTSSPQEDVLNDSLLVTVMYFVNWIDQTFEVLGKLASAIYQTDYKDNENLFEVWKNDIINYISELHYTVDELLLSAMTLCKYCLPEDQHIIKARCQVVLRETKLLFRELVDGDIKVTLDTLKLPIMPSNVNILIDVLKDVLYVLETNTNTALLGLLINCFSMNKSAVDILKEHFNSNINGTCSCLLKSEAEVIEDCSFVKEFDLYNERLLQIGSFAVSCSTDKNRILSLRSGLASLEALDPHLVPAIMMYPEGPHATWLVQCWRQEVQDIRDNVFLIVDPAAFVEKSKQMMHQTLLEVLNKNCFNNASVRFVINIGVIVLNFFYVYDSCEPDALSHRDKVLPLLDNLNKVQNECKVVFNLLSAEGDYVYDIKMPQNNKPVSLDQLFKRLKLLYTLVNRINILLHPKDNEDQFFDQEDDEQVALKNITHTVVKNFDTYVNSPRKPSNISRSIFARTSNVRCSTRNFPLLKLTKHLRAKELSFSAQLDELFNTSESKEIKDTVIINKQLDFVRESSSLYKLSPIKNRSSLRKAVLSRHRKITELNIEDSPICDDHTEADSFIDEATSLQITDVLNQLNDLTTTFSSSKPAQINATRIVSANESFSRSNTHRNVLSLNINDATVSKHIWNIPVNSGESVDDTAVTWNTTNMTQPSNVTTLERISDLDLLETKLNSLKLQFETSL